MHVQIKAVRIELLEGDITAQRVDAIVNAANTSLMGGSGVDGAIHAAAGPQLLAETRKLGGCPVGEAKMTKGYQLPARAVIHTVGPIYHPNDPQAPMLLASAYRRSLEVAAVNGVISVAFPSISTGAYHYPLEEASRIALGAFIQYADGQNPSDSIRLIRMVLYNTAARAIYERTLTALLYAR